jgi:hypothetical protein
VKRIAARPTVIEHPQHLKRESQGQLIPSKQSFLTDDAISIENAVASVSCAALCLHSEEPGCDSHAVSLFRIAATEGKLEILIWGEDSRNELETMLHSLTIVHAALNGHLEVLKNLSQIDILWNKQTCRTAAENGHLKLLK